MYQFSKDIYITNKKQADSKIQFFFSSISLFLNDIILSRTLFGYNLFPWPIINLQIQGYNI